MISSLKNNALTTLFLFPFIQLYKYSKYTFVFKMMANKINCTIQKEKIF